METKAQPLGGPLFTRGYYVLLGLAVVGIALILWRFAVGLGAATGLSDGYPLGLWIALDVVTGTALACGGYAVAFVVYIFNKGQYHPLVRPAVLTSALGYTIGGASVIIDIGRPWNVWKVPIQFWHWNLNSSLLEVALCIMAYVVVLWIELSPALLENAKKPILVKIRNFLNKALIWIIALGMLLPTMHQSSLGSLMMLAGPKLHPLWLTGWLPLLFLMTCLAMGYSIVVFESVFSATAFHRKPETPMLINLQKVAVWLGLAFVVVRFIDLIANGNIRYATKLDLFGTMFWIETVLWILPLLMMLANPHPNLGSLFRQAIVIAFAGALYRFDTYLVAFQPGPGWHYFPTVPEMFISIGLISLELAGYVAIVKRFPILGGLGEKA
ncbi:MAG TPA: Ni/Fe-hydrogenase cytochrome b subunit [Thermoanaerobaculia bacterium]|nr:Ni/Fe-hydrogenase cytochrome b subunit [Thermoanaerobaculia bacterium]